MGTRYTELYDMVLSKIKDYDFLNMSQEDTYAILSDYMLPAAAEFRICRTDLSQTDDEGFTETLTNTEKEILANYITINYIDSNYIRVPLALKQQLSSKDFNAFSPANQLEKLQSVRDGYRTANETLLSRYAWIKADGVSHGGSLWADTQTS